MVMAAPESKRRRLANRTAAGKSIRIHICERNPASDHLASCRSERKPERAHRDQPAIRPAAVCGGDESPIENEATKTGRAKAGGLAFEPCREKDAPHSFKPYIS